MSWKKEKIWRGIRLLSKYLKMSYNGIVSHSDFIFSLSVISQRSQGCIGLSADINLVLSCH